MRTLKSVKNAVIASGIVLGSLLSISGVASAWGYPRVGNRALESLCANPDFFESIAVGRACTDYYNGGNWQGRGGWDNNHRWTSDDTSNTRSGLTPDRFFDRLD